MLNKARTNSIKQLCDNQNRKEKKDKHIKLDIFGTSPIHIIIIINTEFEKQKIKNKYKQQKPLFGICFNQLPTLKNFFSLFFICFFFFQNKSLC